MSGSRNFGAAERCFSAARSGRLSVGAGADNGFGGDSAGCSLTTQCNGASAKVRGLELNYSQQFTFLPVWLSGFAAYGNLTLMETEGNYGGANVIAVAPNPTGKVAGFNSETSNAGVSYIRNKLTCGSGTTTAAAT